MTSIDRATMSIMCDLVIELHPITCNQDLIDGLKVEFEVDCDEEDILEYYASIENKTPEEEDFIINHKVCK